MCPVTPTPCSSCAARGRVWHVRDSFVSDRDTTLGLDRIDENLFACPTCGLRFSRRVEWATMFHDYDEYYYTRLDLPAPTRRVTVFRCPRCGATDAGPDESRSMVELTFMHCSGCGHGGLVDSWERDCDWQLEIDLSVDAADLPSHVAPLAPGAGIYDPVPVKAAEPGFGCAHCAGEDGPAAWNALHAVRVRTLIAEPHFGVEATQCACGQPFAVVFLERVGCQDRDDDQTWLALPLTADEWATLGECAVDQVPRQLEEFGRARRFLVRARTADGSLGAWWRTDGFAIGPHD